MAIFHCQAKAISRGSGRTATAAAAYRAGEKIVDERTGEVHDYRRKEGVLYSEVLTLDSRLIVERKDLWNMAEAAEKRKDAKVAREWEVALPEELTASQRINLARDFSSFLVKRYGVAADVTIHAPGREGDQRNFHAHILTTTRKFDEISLTLTEKTRVLDSPKTSGQEVSAVRRAWAEMVNRALERAGHEAHISHESLDAQGIDRRPTVHLGPTATAIERKGEASRRGEGNRAIKAAQEAAAELAEVQREIAAADIPRMRGGDPMERIKTAIQRAPFATVQELLKGLKAAVDAEKDAARRAEGQRKLDELKPLYYARLADERERHQDMPQKRTEMPLEGAKASKDTQTGIETPNAAQKPKQRGDRER